MARVGSRAFVAEHALPERVVQRVLERVNALGDCLLSTYSSGAKGDYRQVGFHVNGEPFKLLVHRVAWIAEHGPIAEDMTVHHKCFQPACVNVDHMELMPVFENTRRQGGADWPLGTCRNGHPNENLRYYGGCNRCMLCVKANGVRQNARRKAARC